MSWSSLQSEIISGLMSLGYHQFKGSQTSFDKGNNIPETADKCFIIRPESIDDKSISNTGTIGTHEITIEVVYKGTTQTQMNDNYGSFESLVTGLFDVTAFGNFLGLNGKPSFRYLNSKQLGIIKALYGLRGS